MSHDVDFLEQTDFYPFQSAVDAKSIMHFYAELQREAASFLGDKASLDALEQSIGESHPDHRVLASYARVLKIVVRSMEDARARITDTLVANPGLMQQGTISQLLLAAERRHVVLSEVELLSSEGVTKLTKCSAAQLKQEKRVFSVVGTNGVELFPAYQFDPETGVALAVIEQVISAFPISTTGWELAFWFHAQNGYLNGARPSDCLLVNAEAVAQAAIRANEPLDF